MTPFLLPHARVHWATLVVAIADRIAGLAAQ